MNGSIPHLSAVGSNASSKQTLAAKVPGRRGKIHLSPRFGRDGFPPPATHGLTPWVLFFDHFAAIHGDDCYPANPESTTGI
jgi:hypothetical protein